MPHQKVFAAAVLLMAARVGAGELFRDTFEQKPGPPAKWSVAFAPAAGASLAAGNSGDATPGFLRLRGVSDANVGVRSPKFADQKSVWLHFTWQIDAAVADSQSAVISPVDQDGNFPCDLRCVPRDEATYDVVVLAKDAGGSPTSRTLSTAVPYRTPQRWDVQITIDQPGQAVTVSAYRNGQRAAADLKLRPFTSTPAINALQVWGNGNDWRISDVLVSDTPTLDPAAATDLPAGLAAVTEDTAPLSFIDATTVAETFTLDVAADGRILLQTSAGEVAATSAFGKPGGGYFGFGTAEPLRPRVTPLPNGRRMEAACAAFSLKRDVIQDGDHVIVLDTFTNRTADVVGIPFRHELQTPNTSGGRVAGVFRAPGYRLATPETPFVQINRKDVAVGLIARDDAYRNQAAGYSISSGVGLETDSFALPPRGSTTVRWELYPTRAATPRQNHFAFMNAVRRAWGSDRVTIPGLYGFVYPQRQWTANGKRLADMDVAEMKQWLRVTGLHTIGVIIDANKDAAGYNPNDPKQAAAIANLGQVTPIEAFGSDYLTATWSKAYWAKIIARLKEAKPDLIVTPYFHMGCDPGSPALDDCRMMLADGTPKSFANFAAISRNYYYATPANAFGGVIQSVVDQIFAEPQWNGFYWDEYSFGHRPVPLAVADWDGHTAELDPATHAVKRKLSLAALVTQPMRTRLNEQIARKGWTLWTNWQPTSRADVERLDSAGKPLKEPAHSFLEYFRPEEAARGQINSPLCCGGGESRTQQDVMSDVHRYLGEGLLYVHYGNSAYAETSPSILRDCYPITPVRIGPGFVVGRERVLTARSGTFGLGDNRPLRTIIYGSDGLKRPDQTAQVKRDGRTFADVKLAPGEVAIVVVGTP